MVAVRKLETYSRAVLLASPAMIGVLLVAMASPLYTAPVCWSGFGLVKLFPELSTAMTACALTPFGPANFPVGSMPGFQPTMVPSSVTNRNTAGAVVVWLFLSGPVILKAPLDRAVLNAAPV